MKNGSTVFLFKMNTPENFADDRSVSMTLGSLTPPIVPVECICSLSISAIRLSAKDIYFWEKNEWDPKENTSWLKITHIIVEELWIDQKSQVRLGHPNPEESELTHIRTYLPWLNRIKLIYPWVKIIWSFCRNPAYIFVEGM